MDGLFKGRVTAYIKNQICFIVNSKEREIKIMVVGAQQQANVTQFHLLFPKTG